MLKYKIARAMAWLLVATGTILAVSFLVLQLAGLVSPMTVDPAISVRGILAGIGIALAGFLCHVVFDVGETYLLNARRPD